MKIKNIGKKIIHIGNETLLPGGEIVVGESIAATPAVQILAAHNLLVITDGNTITTPKAEPVAVPVTPPTAAPAADATDANGKKGGKKGGSDTAVK